MSALHRPGVLPQAARLLTADRWSSHPRFPHQTLLLRSHASFRRTGAALIARAQAGDDAQSIGWSFRWWKGAMGGHEAYEEGKLYPYLELRWGLSMAPAEQGHRALSVRDRAVRAALSPEATRPPGGTQEALVEALEGHQETLLAHLALEEALVIPALLSLSPQEFEDYSNSSIQRLRRAVEAQLRPR